MLHISDIKHYDECKSSIYYNRIQKDNILSIVNYNGNVLDSFLNANNINNYYEGIPYSTNEDSFNALLEYNEYINIRFQYKNLRIKISYMKKINNSYDIYFFYSVLFPKESNAQYISDTINVLYKLNININNIILVSLNPKYIREDILEHNKIYRIIDSLYNEKNKITHTLEELIQYKYRDIDELIDELNISKDKEIKLDDICHKGKCEFKDKCINYKHEDDLSKLYEPDKFICGRNHYARLINKDLFVDYFALQSWLSKIDTTTISYLDFEWETYLYPPYKGMKPLDTLCFQYSLHIENNNELTHYNFLGKKDCREDFIISLINDLPSEGSIIVFNAKGGEELKLRQLIIQYPQYTQELLSIIERIIDISLPFMQGVIYSSEMEGNYTLKKIAQIFVNVNYSEIDINHGTIAAKSMRYLNNHEIDTIEEEHIRNSLIEYCSLDTMSLYLIYHKLLQIAEIKKKELLDNYK